MKLHILSGERSSSSFKVKGHIYGDIVFYKHIACSPYFFVGDFDWPADLQDLPEAGENLYFLYCGDTGSPGLLFIEKYWLHGLPLAGSDVCIRSSMVVKNVTDIDEVVYPLQGLAF
ncbi:hypothetical protein DPMN_001592 [Dreissena polymorpha]|uniref:Uncharacterized protein n=1 Tax=Dreissena polymorpha TaxID=45954 RepID=A0A9D4MK33_DREPO|nr:hypothetical protein DPMN_001592 [Dreissena polymorpha]